MRFANRNRRVLIRKISIIFRNKFRAGNTRHRLKDADIAKFLRRREFFKSHRERVGNNRIFAVALSVGHGRKPDRRRLNERFNSVGAFRRRVRRLFLHGLRFFFYRVLRFLFLCDRDVALHFNRVVRSLRFRFLRRVLLTCGLVFNARVILRGFNRNFRRFCYA